MELARRATVFGGSPHMQWLCGTEVIDDALRTAALLERVHGIAVDVWRVADWAAMAEEGLLNERLWLAGARAQAGSRLERLLAATPGPILAISRGPRSTPELLRAFAPRGRRYLSLGAADAASILQAALRLAEEDGSDWIRLAVT